MQDILSNARAFSNCISLGWYCGTASAMAKYGLRSSSGPFDWYWSDLKPVIKQIETRFTDFLVRENLEPLADRPKGFRDCKYGFEYFHDIENDLDTDYNLIYSKYKRRSDRFLNMAKKPTVFFRAVRSKDEISYISKNHQYIEEVLQDLNQNNIIVYLCPNDIGNFPQETLAFGLHIKDYVYDAGGLRDMFDSSPELVQLCRQILDADTIKYNKRFDLYSNDSCAADIYSRIKEDDPEVGRGILKLLNAEEDEGILLWGIGHQGTAMYTYLKGKKIKIKGLIDSNCASRSFDTYTISSFDSIEAEDKVFISIADKKAVRSIKNRLKEKYPKIRVADYYELSRVIEEQG